MALSNDWHIDKKITVGHLVTTLVVGISAVMYITTVEKRVSILEEKQVLIREMVADDLTGIKNQLIRIETKIDGKADKK